MCINRIIYYPFATFLYAAAAPRWHIYATGDPITNTHTQEEVEDYVEEEEKEQYRNVCWMIPGLVLQIRIIHNKDEGT